MYCFEVAKENPDMLRLLSDPIIRKNQKKNSYPVLAISFQETKNFLDFLLEYRRFESLTAIIEAFNTILYDEYKNIASGTAVSAIKLNEDELSRISQAYAKKLWL